MQKFGFFEILLGLAILVFVYQLYNIFVKHLSKKVGEVVNIQKPYTELYSEVEIREHNSTRVVRIPTQELQIEEGDEIEFWLTLLPEVTIIKREFLPNKKGTYELNRVEIPIYGLRKLRVLPKPSEYMERD